MTDGVGDIKLSMLLSTSSPQRKSAVFILEVLGKSRVSVGAGVETFGVVFGK